MSRTTTKSGRGRPAIAETVKIEFDDETAAVFRLLADGRIQIELPHQWAIELFERSPTKFGGRTRATFLYEEPTH